MRHVFIINPMSGKGKALKIVENIKRVCEEENIDYIKTEKLWVSLYL